MPVAVTYVLNLFVTHVLNLYPEAGVSLCTDKVKLARAVFNGYNGGSRGRRA